MSPRKGGEAPRPPPFFFSVRLVKGATLLVLLSPLAVGCAGGAFAGFHGATPARFAEADARVRADLGVPDGAPSPRVVLVDRMPPATLDARVREELRQSGGGLYDPQTQTIYLDASRFRDPSLYHELVHHYVRFMTEQQREECLARLYELHVAHGSFSGCAR